MQAHENWASSPILSAALFLLSLLACAGCTSAGAPLSALAPVINATRTLDDRILPGDGLEVRFPYASEWTHSTTVSPVGKASFLGVDELVAADLTVMELDQRLTDEYEEVLRKPDLTVRVVTPAPRTAAILGEVKKPGQYGVTGGSTLLDLFAAAEGHLKPTARLKNILFLRWIPAESHFRAWIIDARTEQWASAEPLYVQPRDIVYIPHTEINQVNIWVDQYIRRMIPLPVSPVEL